MGLITHNRIYVCIGASLCLVIVDLVIIGSDALSLPPSTPPPLLPLCKRWCCTLSAWVVAPSTGVATIGRHLVGRRRRLARALPLLAAAPASVSLGRGATPCGLATGNRHQWPGRGRCLCPQAQPCPRAVAPAGDCTLMDGCPCKGVLAMAGRPLTGGLVHRRLPLAAGLAVGGRPVGKPTAGASHTQRKSKTKTDFARRSNRRAKDWGHEKNVKIDKTATCERLILPREIVYPCIPDPDGEDEGGQASSSLAVSTRWISAAKLLLSDLATLAQREGGE
ncbi:hypothetical protein GW17_00034469 [Ensete ventricosum]|nr:hypothetical protein GW17_00034469 [Ensete ventricosum]